MQMLNRQVVKSESATIKVLKSIFCLQLLTFTLFPIFMVMIKLMKIVWYIDMVVLVSFETLDLCYLSWADCWDITYIAFYLFIFFLDSIILQILSSTSISPSVLYWQLISLSSFLWFFLYSSSAECLMYCDIYNHFSWLVKYMLSLTIY